MFRIRGRAACSSSRRRELLNSRLPGRLPADDPKLPEMRLLRLPGTALGLSGLPRFPGIR